MQFWGTDRLVISTDDSWQVLAWPSMTEKTRGEGRVAAEPGGDRLAVRDDAGGVHLHRGGPVALPDEVEDVGGARSVRWDGDGGLVVVAGQPAIAPPRVAGLPLLPPPESGATAQRWGDYPDEGMSLWRVSPDGHTPPRRLAACGGIERIDDPQPFRDGLLVDWYRYQVFRRVGAHRVLWVPLDGGEPTDPFEDLPGSTFAAAPDPAGRRVALLHDPDEPLYPYWNRLVLATGDSRRLLLPEHLRLAGRPRWSPDGRVVAVRAFDGIRTGIAAADVEAVSWRWLVPPVGAVESFAVAPGGREAVTVWRSVTVPAGLFRWNSSGRTPLAGYDGEELALPQQVVRWSAHGADLEGVLTVPREGPDGPWPVIVDLHGGPVNGLDLFAAGRAVPWRAWCDAGYAVFAPDFRSSGIAGRDALHAAFRFDVDDPTGGSDVADVLAGVEALVERDDVDPDRLFAFGFSFGGGLVNRLLAHDNPFRAAACYEGEADRRMTYGVAGGGSPLIRELMGGTPWEVPERYDAASAITDAARVDTPLLLLYGEQRAPEALCWYAALRDHGVDTDLVVYRGEGHLNRQPANREDLLARSVDWFERHGP